MQLLSPSPILGASWANALGSLLPSQFATSSRDVPFLSGEVTPLSGSATALLVHHQWMVLSDFLGYALIVFVHVVLFFFVFIGGFCIVLFLYIVTYCVIVFVALIALLYLLIVYMFSIIS